MSLKEQARKLLSEIFLLHRVDEIENWTKIVDLLFLYVDLEIEDKIKRHEEEVKNV